MKGFISILILGLWLSPSPSSALPDLLAPFRNMFGMKGSNSGSSKQSSKDHLKSHFPGGGGFNGGPEDSTFDFGHFGDAPTPPGGHPKSFGSGPYSSGPPKISHGPPKNSHGRGPHQRDPHLSPWDSHSHSHSPPSHGHESHGPSSPSSSPYSHPSSRPISSSPSSSGSSRPVRQQPGSGSDYRLRPSYSHGGPGGSSSSGGGPGTEDDDAMDLASYKPGPPPKGFQESSAYHREPPKYISSSFGGEGSNSPFSGPGGSNRPFSSSSPSDGSQYSQDGPSSQGQGFSGFGSFPSSDDEDSPRGRPGGYGRPRPFRGSRPGPQFDGHTSSSPPSFGGPSSGGGRPFGGPPGGSSPSGPAYFGGPSDYPEQFQGGNRDTRQPEIITANDVNKYPAQIEDDDEQGGPGFGPPPPGSRRPGGRPSGFGGPPEYSSGGRPGGRPSGPPSGRPGGFGFGPSSSGPGGPFGPPGGSSSSSPRPFPSGGPFGGEEEDSPRYPSGSGNSFSFSRPVSAGYQASSESVHYGKPMMVSASATEVSKVNPTLKPKVRSGRLSASYRKQSPKILPLMSPKDPNYRGMSPSSLNPVSRPFEPDTAATGGHEEGGFEGLSHNGDRILYHVAGHQGPLSYRFGYDTGKGYNRLFRFEEKDGHGLVKGKYGFYDKHGKLNVINYEAHPKHGFHAERGHSHGHY